LKYIAYQSLKLKRLKFKLS